MQPTFFKTFILFFLVLAPAFSAIPVQADSNRAELRSVSDARQEARLSQQRQLPILIMFGTEECPFCHLLKEDFLIPMIISGDYTDKVFLRQVYVIDDAEIIDFSGHKISTREFARRYQVRLFPTTVLVDHKGQPLVNNIIGVTTPSLFGGTLDDAIDKALLLLKGKRSR